MTEYLRGDGLMKSAAAGLISVMRGANETGTPTYHVGLANKYLPLLMLPNVPFYLNRASLFK